MVAGPQGREGPLNPDSGDVVLCLSFAMGEHASHLTFLQLTPPFSKMSLKIQALPIRV